jgi:hypothetical protein
MLFAGYTFMHWLNFPPTSALSSFTCLRFLLSLHPQCSSAQRYCRLLTLLRLICKMENLYGDHDVMEELTHENEKGYCDGHFEFTIATEIQGVNQFSKNDRSTNPNTVPSSSAPTWNDGNTSSLPGSIYSCHSHSTATSDIWTPDPSSCSQSSIFSEPEEYPVTQSLISTTQGVSYTVSSNYSLHDGILSDPCASTNLPSSHNQALDTSSGQPSPKHGR